MMDAPAAANDTALRSVTMTRGRRLVVRAADDRDVDGLMALYEGLDDESRYRRFFSTYHPRRAFFERAVAAPTRGGVELVAVLSAPGATECVVAEAGYEPLPNGNGELAITVDRHWRGWLGPFLLDALVEHAAAGGVPNLEAEVLVRNGPMLALLRARGQATRPKQDWSVVRVVIGTTGPTPTWPSARDGVRVVVEGTAGPWRDVAAKRHDDVEVLVCPGPARRPACPALGGGRCPLAGDADAVVVSPARDDESWHTLRGRHRDLHPDVPVYVDVTHSSGELGAGEVPFTAGDATDVVDLVRRARAAAMS